MIEATKMMDSNKLSTEELDQVDAVHVSPPQPETKDEEQPSYKFKKVPDDNHDSQVLESLIRDQFQDRSLWVKFKVPIFGEIRFNPVVSFVAITLIWIFVAICSIYGETLPFGEWKGESVNGYLNLSLDCLFFFFPP